MTDALHSQLIAETKDTVSKTDLKMCCFAQISPRMRINCVNYPPTQDESIVMSYNRISGNVSKFLCSRAHPVVVNLRSSVHQQIRIHQKAHTWRHEFDIGSNNQWGRYQFVQLAFSTGTPGTRRWSMPWLRGLSV